MMRNGIAFALPTLVPHTCATGYGLWQTPVADDAVNRTVGKFNSRGEPKLSAQAILFPTPTVTYTRENWPADRIAARQQEVKAASKAKGNQTGNGFGLNLSQAARFFPTPSARDWKGAPSSVDTLPSNSRPLNEVVRFWPTPTVDGNYNRAGASATSGDGLATAAGGSLNPPWVEWLMGFPIGWTELEPSETPLSPKSRKSSAKQS
jgi:hypothetical protein